MPPPPLAEEAAVAVGAGPPVVGGLQLGRRMRQREAARALVHGTIKTLREAALRYVLANGLVSVVVPGARTPEHARLNAHAADTQPYLPDDDLASIGDILARSGVAT
jgi:aryl-alcohol dehydrogenase-like predicted oxidoreductase